MTRWESSESGLGSTPRDRKFVAIRMVSSRADVAFVESNMNSRTTVAVLGMGIVATILAGCGPAGPKTIPVSGTVLRDGNPIAGGIVRFNPADPKQGHLAEGKLDPSGKFILSTFQPGDGALAGDYNITVLPAVESPNELAKDKAKNAANAAAIPPKYQDPKTSGLKETIQSGKPRSDIKLELKGE